MTRFLIHHATTYRYAQPVVFGPHRLMLRPRDSHDLRMLDATLMVSPSAVLRWSYDVFGNSVAQATFENMANELTVVSDLHVERYSAEEAQLGMIAPEAAHYPFVYSPSDRIDLGGTDQCHYPDPREQLTGYARSFLSDQPADTLALLTTINSAINRDITYSVRYDEGTQAPLDTLQMRSGSCRDLAMLMVETVRCLGLGARFVTGYLYDAALDGGPGGTVGAGQTHAWLEIYVPGAGWIEFDPTNNSINSPDLIRVAVTRDAAQAIPLTGSFNGQTNDFLGMEVVVTVRKDVALAA